MAQRLPWPLPAILAWGGCWLIFRLASGHGLLPALALVLAALTGLLLSLAFDRWWRRIIVAAGFPLALVASGATIVPGWAWLVPMLAALLVYPVKAWRDAPLFPTPPGALAGLTPLLALPQDAAVLDAGCRLGHGLLALRAAFPQARLHGIEGSWPLRAWCGLRCSWAQVVRHGDIWQASWRPIRWSICSSSPRACLGRWPRPLPTWHRVAGWSAWNSKPRNSRPITGCCCQMAARSGPTGCRSNHVPGCLIPRAVAPGCGPASRRNIRQHYHAENRLEFH